MTDPAPTPQRPRSGLPRGLIIFFAVHFLAIAGVAIFLMWKLRVFG